MLLSAASLFLTVAFTDFNDLSERELKAWKKIQPSVATLVDGNRACGSAALISRDGYFITHASSFQGKRIAGVRADGSRLEFQWVAMDEPTQLVLLKAADWTDSVAPVSIASTDAGAKTLLAITPTGPIRAERAKATFGIVNPSRRLMPLSEIYIENNLPTLSGSLLFDLEGKLAGALNATLGMSEAQNLQKTRAQSDFLPKGVGGGGAARGSGAFQYGPGILTAAYTIGHKVLNRVVNGFLSPSHDVKHPAIGIFCKDALPLGALIQSVTKGSEAEKAGLLKDDVIYAINNEAVRNQIDFARIISAFEIGDKLRIWIKRNGLQQMVSVEVGYQS